MSWMDEMVKEARHGGSDAERSLWYHGTSAARVPAILSSGLVPSPKKKTWAEDPEASVITPSRASVGGIYLTDNLMTARSSATNAVRRKGGLQKGDAMAIVVVEAQPRTFVMDEDKLLMVHAHIAFDMPWMVIEAFMAREMGTNPDFIDEARIKYALRVTEEAQHMFEGETKVPADKPMMSRNLKSAVYNEAWKGWDTVLNRQAAYAAEQEPYRWKELFWNSCPKEKHQEIVREIDRRTESGMEQGEAYSQVVTEFMPKPPDKGAAETAYSAYADRLTRILKHLARPHMTPRSYNRTARCLEPIGFSGSNRIVCIIEYAYDRAKYGDYHDRVKVVYGEIPPQFKQDWESNVGEMVLVKDFEAPSPGVPGTTPEEFEPKVASWNFDAFMPRQS